MSKLMLILLFSFSFIRIINAEEKEIAVLQITNKMTSKSFKLNIHSKTKINLNNLSIKVTKCLTSKSDDLIHATFLRIRNEKKNISLFNGWIFSNNPSISEFYNQIYALKLIKCESISK